MKATIKDVAKEAGVSTGTVDRVINNKKHVAPATKNRVLEAINKLNYTKSPIAKALVKSKKTIKIGVIFPKLEHYFWDEVFKGIEFIKKKLEAFGVEIIVENTKTYNLNEHKEATENLVKKNVDGIAMISYDSDECVKIINRLKEINIDVVTFVSDSPNSRRLAFVGEDSIKAGRIAGKLMGLYLQGEGDIVVIGIHKILSCMSDRIKGFIEILENDFKNVNIIEVIEFKEFEFGEEEQYRENITESIEKIIKKHRNIKGIYVTNSFTGSVGKILEKDNLKDRITLIGHEDTEEIRELIKKDIVKATVYQNQQEEIIKSINILYEKISNEKIYPKNKFIEPGILIKEKLDI